METWDAICARRNMRQYKPEPVSDDLNRIAEPEWCELGEASNSGSPILFALTYFAGVLTIVLPNA